MCLIVDRINKKHNFDGFLGNVVKYPKEQLLIDFHGDLDTGFS